MTEENDLSIKVNIHRSQLLEVENMYTIHTLRLLQLFRQLNYYNNDDELKRDENVLYESLYDEIKRDETKELDISKRNCRITEMNENCCICNEKLKLGEKISKIVCNHIFHYVCIKEWGKYKQECPLCRTKIKYKIKA